VNNSTTVFVLLTSGIFFAVVSEKHIFRGNRQSPRCEPSAAAQPEEPTGRFAMAPLKVSSSVALMKVKKEIYAIYAHLNCPFPGLPWLKKD